MSKEWWWLDPPDVFSTDTISWILFRGNIPPVVCSDQLLNLSCPQKCFVPLRLGPDPVQDSCGICPRCLLLYRQSQLRLQDWRIVNLSGLHAAPGRVLKVGSLVLTETLLSQLPPFHSLYHYFLPRAQRWRPSLRHAGHTGRKTSTMSSPHPLFSPKSPNQDLVCVVTGTV